MGIVRRKGKPTPISARVDQENYVLRRLVAAEVSAQLPAAIRSFLVEEKRRAAGGLPKSGWGN